MNLRDRASDVSEIDKHDWGVALAYGDALGVAVNNATGGAESRKINIATLDSCTQAAHRPMALGS